MGCRSIDRKLEELRLLWEKFDLDMRSYRFYGSSIEDNVHYSRIRDILSEGSGTWKEST